MRDFIDEQFSGSGPLGAPWSARSSLTIEDGSDSTAELADTDQVGGVLTVGGSGRIILEHATAPPANYRAEQTLHLDPEADAPAYVYIFLRAEESVPESPDVNGLLFWGVTEGLTARVKVYECENRNEGLLNNSTLALSSGEQDVVFGVEIEGNVLRTFVNGTQVAEFPYESSTFDSGTRLLWRVSDDAGHASRFRASTLGGGAFWTDFEKSKERDS